MSNNYSHKPHTALISQVTVREATADDGGALRRLAELDSSHVPADPMVVAEVGGEMRAAVSMSDGGVIADPFHPTKEVVEMMKIHAKAPAARRALGYSGRQRPLPTSPSIPGFPVLPAN